MCVKKCVDIVLQKIIYHYKLPNNNMVVVDYYWIQDTTRCVGHYFLRTRGEGGNTR
jgi:hypothetical protein